MEVNFQIYLDDAECVRKEEKMKLELKKHKYYLLVLTAMFFVLIYLFVPEGSVFGSNTDWMSQHAELAETLRDACLSQGTIFPDFLWLGGGSNAYEFAYYGYLRPDIVVGCLLPQVPMILYSDLFHVGLCAGFRFALLLFSYPEPHGAVYGVYRQYLSDDGGVLFSGASAGHVCQLYALRTACASPSAEAGGERKVYTVYGHAHVGDL